MSIRANVLCLLLSCAPLPVFSQFEGVVESVNTTVDEVGTAQKFTMTIWLKSSWVRVSTSGSASLPGTTMIVRPDLQIHWVLNDSDKTYFEVRLPDQKAPSNPAGKHPSGSSVHKTGKTKKILGYLCDEYRITHDEVSTELWGARSLGALQTALTSAFGEDESEGEGWTADLASLGVYPMSARTRVDGVLIESQDVIKIERRSLPADLFSLPEGYRKHSINDTLK
jgi:hypothetical protein